MITAPSISQDIAAFAALVRARLGDLAPEEVDDLTDGLEADLTEKAEEEDLGDAEAYADELRSAAGLAPRSTSTSTTSARLRRVRDDLSRSIHSSPAATATLAFLTSIRPAWWVLRALVGTYLIGLALDGVKNNPVGWTLTFMVLLVISVQWGRGLWMPRRWLRLVRVIANTLAIVVLPFALASLIHQAEIANYTPSAEATAAPQGLVRNGGSVTNIFAYDSNGEPLTGVQLFDQNGKPLSAKPPYQDYITTNDETALVPNSRVTTGNGWNVFPFESVPLSAFDANSNKPNTTVTPTPVKLPFTKVQPLVDPAPLTEVQPSASPSASPLATPAP